MSPGRDPVTTGSGADAATISVLCVDDNQQVADAVRVKLGRAGGFAWKGWLPSADALVATVQIERPDVVILDIDMPGRNPFDALADLAAACPEARVILYSGHVRFELIDRAMESGAWGYVSKNDSEDALVQAVRDVVAGELALSPEVRAAYERMG